MKTDVACARTIIAGMLRPTLIEETDENVYAQMHSGPALRIAVGADVD